MDPSNSSVAAGSSSGAKRRGRPPGSGNKAKIPTQWTPSAGGPLRIGAPRQDEANRAATGASGALTLRGPAPGGALNSPSPLAAAPAPRAQGSVDRALWEVAVALGPPAADPPAPPENGVVAAPRHLAAAMLGPLITPGSRFLELLVVVDAPGFSFLRLPDAVRRVIYAPSAAAGEIALGKQSRPELLWPMDILLGAGAMSSSPAAGGPLPSVIASASATTSSSASSWGRLRPRCRSSPPVASAAPTPSPRRSEEEVLAR
jgi:hypothetical protein